jgi:hypothetical protein
VDENDKDDEMGSGVIMAEDDDMEINGPEDVLPEEEEDEELEPASDEDGGETLTPRTMRSLAYYLANVLELVFCDRHAWTSGL